MLTDCLSSRRLPRISGLIVAIGLAAVGCQHDEEMSPAPRVTPGAEPVGTTASPISDTSITQAIETQLWLSPTVPSHRITVMTTEGIATLTGSVSNLRAKERAAEIAEAIKGVRSVVNEVVVAPEKRSAAAIERDIKAALAADPTTEPWEIETKVNGTKVTLSGEVSSWQEKRLAADVAKGVRGVTALDNLIEVSYTTKRSDRDIAEDVRARLRRDLRIDAALVDVKVQDHDVALSGQVGSAWEKTRAWNDAWVRGVRDVDSSKIAVSWTARPEMVRAYTPIKTDASIAKAVEDALFYDPRVVSFEPEVTVDDGIVTLGGTVDNLAAKQAAEKDALDTVGVVRVVNRLAVEPKTMAEDAAIATDVRAALRRDPVLYLYDIDTRVVDGEVFLSGTVPTHYDKRLVSRVVRHVQGVEAVTNNILVNRPVVVRSDWEIKHDIESQLFWSPFVDADEVTVSVLDGVATLTGTVDSLLELRAAEEQALEGGAWKVRNQLKLKLED